MRRFVTLVTLGLVATPQLAAAGSPGVAPAGDPAVVEALFRQAVVKARGPHAGDLFTLPNPYNYICEKPYAVDDVSHVPGHGLMHTRGTFHPTLWRYDAEIPLVFYGHGRVRAGVRLLDPATQQDLPATLAWLLGTAPPRDCVGTPLKAAFLPGVRAPKAVLTIVLDQGGRTLYAAHPGRYPAIARLMAEGTDYVKAAVTHPETETGPGHVAIGTGAYPAATGIPANDFYQGGVGSTTYAFTAESEHSPFYLQSPTLGDEWLRVTDNRAIVIGQSHSDRAAMGMAGHGAAYRGNKKPFVVFYDTHSGHLVTNPAYYTLPTYLEDLDSKAFWQPLTHGTGKWLDHDIGNANDVRRSPALVTLEGESFSRMLAHEPIGQDDVCDLLYVSFKSSDAAGHRYGYESDEAGEVLAEIDRQVGRLVAQFEAKVGKDNALVVLTADHGAAPLAELSGGERILDETMLEVLNARFHSPVPHRPAVLFVTSGQVWLDRPALAAAGADIRDVATFLRAYKVHGRPFYRLVLDPAVDTAGS